VAIKEIFETAKNNPGISTAGLFVTLLVGAIGGSMYIKISEQRFALMEQRLKQQEDYSKKQKNMLESIKMQFSGLKQTISSLNSNVSSLRTIAVNIPKTQIDTESTLKEIKDTIILVAIDGEKLERAISRSESITNAFSVLLSAINNNETGQDFDASGFLSTVYATSISGAKISNIDQISASAEIPLNELGPGDLVFFNTMKRAFSHVGIYVGDGKFIHTPTPKSALRIEDIRNVYWEKRFDGARRIASPENQPLVEGFSNILKNEIIDREIDTKKKKNEALKFD
jgi:cell wall-associated NlpC family hydrolase